MRAHLRLLPLLLAAVALSACGDTTHNRVADNEGIYVDVGALKYQVQLSRELNPYDTEDSTYLQGLAPADATLTPTQAWFGVFMQVFNKTSHSQQPASQFYITDTQGIVYWPTPVPASNPFGYAAATIPPHSQIPSLDSAAYSGPTQGAALVFKMTIASFEDRPLVLHIIDPQQPQNSKIAATVQLDV